ncbi:DUF3667 domain-containing protein [Reichenbachiella ulvae]|uniref:DUF3667 domain-containing protein n=1 Tax=Reichenbachiella ulvae TaxID=2980104 RepID=A0ABT3D0M2_9BACT|nr:DUF3667 domain-containing protein [Reichenbachiella ulvae]MCV9389348.1 DUF3667 domain-containing protein [Reichenbachiella ulvae]
MNCPNCNQVIEQKYCSNCGQPAQLPRIDFQYIKREIASVLSLDKGILLTIRELILRPGENIRSFLQEDRNRLVKPVIFLILCSLVYSIAQGILKFEDGYINVHSDESTSSVMMIFNWVQGNYGYANIMMSFLFALWVKLFFRKNNYNFFEILVLMFFVMGIGMLIYAVFGIAENITSLKILHLGGMLGLIYVSWAIGQFFQPHKAIIYVKSFLAYLLGMVSFVITLVSIGILLDWWLQ